jgi:small subunit ribosomal protein S17
VSEATAKVRGRRKSFIGTVVSNKMDKTAVVAVERRHQHPLYRKIVRVTKRYKAHDPQNAANLGDVVRIEETRPLSKDKRWRIAETLTRGNVADIAPREIGAPEGALDTAAPVAEAPATPAPAPEAPAESAPEAPAASAPVSTEPHVDEAMAIIEQDAGDGQVPHDAIEEASSEEKEEGA